MEALQLINITPDDFINRIAIRVIELSKPNNEDVWITQKQACKLTGKTAKTIKAWEDKKVKVQRMDGTSPMYLKSDLLKYVKQ